ncbi:hypothetical protein DUNSADRAFT_4380 [Dunaliella salina]|uniref:Uncharacterized protein n=1 Tax=Dunaliella salina TaxID=3046 RepID=A0ABQ7GS83_DUNSA|nr:hypothetical protein DUNSADRAFT_4380 [Dunaliella salina]|eukprot:KAF5837464.1 hypothetical protein DUNSADRAFT_4380 [Dunaliella salina]
MSNTSTPRSGLEFVAYSLKQVQQGDGEGQQDQRPVCCDQLRCAMSTSAGCRWKGPEKTPCQGGRAEGRWVLVGQKKCKKKMLT